MVEKVSVISNNMAQRLCVWGIHPTEFHSKWKLTSPGAAFQPLDALSILQWGFFFVLVSFLCDEKFDVTESQSILTAGSWWVSFLKITQRNEGCGSSSWDCSPLPEHWVAV